MTTPAAHGETARWLPGFIALSALWGSSFALIEIGVAAGVPTHWVARWRWLVGLVARLGVCAGRRSAMPPDAPTAGQ
ncbi:EamA/RhaT family transporter, partial [Actinosynnema sp. NPDC059797]